MPTALTDLPPLSLYVHIPWCVQKCPYCDFNSHEAKGTLPETLYVEALFQELDSYLSFIANRPLISIFFGGGTPSLFSAHAIDRILCGINDRFELDPQIEITLEANPGTLDQTYFQDYRIAGINRLSLGIQSFHHEKLRALGRIHDSEQAIKAINIAKKAGFMNFNLDLMYGLPNQSIDQAKEDIKTALTFHPTHLSWYQLTLEPNTLFYHHPPALPLDEIIWEMQCMGQDTLLQFGLQQYEVSAYSLPKKQCVHNRNYWEFGDYLGIGAGAHSKITDLSTGKIFRFSQVKHPRDYLDVNKRLFHSTALKKDDLIVEFMLNALRLTHGVPLELFTHRTHLTVQHIQNQRDIAVKRGLLHDSQTMLCPTTLGKRFLNDLIEIFLPCTRVC